MALTPNYSWPVPDDTDLVKDGAEAIRDLGNAIDNTVDNLPSGALVHIETSDSGGAVANLSLNDVFSSQFTRYKIFVTMVGSVNQDEMQMRLRVAGSDDSTASSYVTTTTRSGIFNATTVDTFQSTKTLWDLGNYGTGLKNQYEITIANPFLTTATVFSVMCSSSVSNSRTIQLTGTHNQTTSYTGFTLIAESGTITIDKVSVYGLSEA